jgi:myo-inositol 2-dehydrogenase / D-chiro-inositol 1-dehydrogenase
MITTALIGCGDVAEHGHLPALMRNNQFRLTAVCDVDPARAALLAKRGGGVTAYTDWRQLLNREQLDAVVLAVPPEISPSIAIECLQHKLAVLDEKPLAATLDEGRLLAKKVKAFNQVYQVGFVLRYGDWVRSISDLAPTLGTPQIIRVAIHDERLDPSNVTHLSRIQGFLKNSSAMTHEGSHVVDYVSLWNPSPWTRLIAFAEKTSPFFAGPNVWNAQISLADNSTFDLKISWLLPELPHSTISIEGPAGRLHFNCATGSGLYETDDDSKSLTLTPLRAEWDRQYQAFAKAVDCGHVSHASVEDAMRALEVTHACEMSVRESKTIEYDEIRKTSVSRPISTRPTSDDPDRSAAEVAQSLEKTGRAKS